MFEIFLKSATFFEYIWKELIFLSRFWFLSRFCLKGTGKKEGGIFNLIFKLIQRKLAHRTRKKIFWYLLTFKAEAKPVPKVYQLEDLIVNIQRSLKASLKDFSSKDQERVKRFLTHFNSPTSVNYKFETAYFDEIPSCPFHEGNLLRCIVIYSGAAQFISICGTSPLEGPGLR